MNSATYNAHSGRNARDAIAGIVLDFLIQPRRAHIGRGLPIASKAWHRMSG